MGYTNQIRLIGGIHRGRKLPVIDLPGLRPTGDRMRETLFDWLRPTIVGARCLDLFAGSGALGLEAASQGAELVVMLDYEPQVIAQLQANTNLLRLQQVQLVHADAIAWLKYSRCVTAFDVVFLDPPFAFNLIPEVVALLLQRHWLAPKARLYMECARNTAPPPLPTGLELDKERTMGQVWCGLAHYEPLIVE